jgi:carboxymethylenebutenolidase
MGERTVVKGPDGEFAAYVARPAAQAEAAIVVIQEIFGVNGVMRAIADDLAGEGYLAICPDLFWRIEPGIELTDRSEGKWKRAFELYQAFNVDLGVRDIAATVAHAATLPGISGSVGAVGFCLGGLLAFLTAARTDARATACFYGIGIEAHAQEDTRAKPVMLHVAEKDQFVPPPAQQALIAALEDRPGITIHSYPGCDHAFARKGAEHYDAAAADLAWRRTLAFFKVGL